MPDTVKLPAVGKVKKTWVYVGGALVVGIVGYAWWSRGGAGGGAPVAEPGAIPEDYSDLYTEGREPPPTMVGGGAIDDFGAGAIINTNVEWFTAALGALSDVGYEPMTVAATLGKFLQRKPLTAEEQVLVQAAKGAVGEPPLGGPWPIIAQLPPPATTPPPSTTPPPPGTKPSPISPRGDRVNATQPIRSYARHFSTSTHADSVESTVRWIWKANPWLKRTSVNGKPRGEYVKRGWIVVVPRGIQR